MAKQHIKGRGSQINTPNPFSKYIYDNDPLYTFEEGITTIKTKYLEVHPKTIVNKITSPDIPMDYSLNPYQGCEHGCVYCYARNTHPFWGYSAGLEFEQKILIKKDAAKLLEKKLQSPRWQAKTIMLSGNTDCYQPIEKEKKITRSLLEICLKYRHPVGIITKNSLVLRDLDILLELKKYNLIKVAISITTLDETLRKFLEPRTASAAKRLETVRRLSEAGIAPFIMLSPIIPGLNDHEILNIAKETAVKGANSIGHSIVRLDGDVKEIFIDWLFRTFPDRAAKVLNQIALCHGGALGDKRFGKRMGGEGRIAQIIRDQMQLARRLYFKDRLKNAPLNCDMHEDFKTPQLKLF